MPADGCAVDDYEQPLNPLSEESTSRPFTETADASWQPNETRSV